MSTIVVPRAQAGEPAERKVLEEPQPRPVIGWAALGVVCFGIFLYTWGGWILSGDARPVPIGPSKVPTYMTVSARIQEVVSLLGALAILFCVLIRPWWRKKHITQDGLMVLAFLVLPWQDSVVNYIQNWFVYSSVYFNLGGWDRWVPGWMPPNGNLVVEPIVWDVPFYVWGGYGGMVVGAWFLRKVKVRHPNITTFRLIMVACVAGTLFDFIVEPLLWTMTGAWSWMSVIKPLTLWYGHYYQFPIYEGICAGVWWGGAGQPLLLRQRQR